MNIILDTSIIIGFIRQDSLPAVLSKEKHSFFISDITIAELYAGKSVWESKKKNKQLFNIIDSLTHLPTNLPICKLAGKIRSFQNTQVPDAIIAATAIHHKMHIATLNTKDFANIPNLDLVKI